MTVTELKKEIDGREKLLAKLRQAKSDGALRVSELESRRRNFAVAKAVKNDASTAAQLADIEKDLDRAKNDAEHDALAVGGIEVALLSLKESLARAEFEAIRGAAVKRISSIMAAKHEERVNALMAEMVQIFEELSAEYAAALSAYGQFFSKNTHYRNKLQSLAQSQAHLIIHQLGDRLPLPPSTLDRDTMIRSRNTDINAEALLTLDSAIQDLRELKPPKFDPEADEAAA